MDTLLGAISDNDYARVKALLKADVSFATRLISAARLYESGIFHWA